MGWRCTLLGLSGAIALGCTSGPTAPSSASAACIPRSTSANAVLPVFGRPFDGAFPIGNFFDHDKPIEGAANGCSGTPHLHFGVGRDVAGRYVLIDPYGWHGPTNDPWELDSRGAASVWLWKDGAAPSLR